MPASSLMSAPATMIPRVPYAARSVSVSGIAGRMCIMIAGVLVATLGMPAMCGFIRTDLAIAIAVTGFPGGRCVRQRPSATLTLPSASASMARKLRLRARLALAFRLA